MLPADHPIWKAVPTVCATIALALMLTFNYNSVDSRDLITTLVVTITTALASYATTTTPNNPPPDNQPFSP